MHVYTVLALYSSSPAFPHFLPPSTGTNPPDRACFALLFSDFVKEKEMPFLKFKIATQGVSL
jgi:hypothetical protein